MLQLTNIVKQYPGVTALDHVDFDLQEGEVHAVVGENGAGKSTLTKILAGVVTPTSGHIRLDGREIKIPTPWEALRLGIGVVHQERNLVPHFSAMDNILLGNEPRCLGFVHTRKMRIATQRLLNDLGLELDISRSVKDLSSPQQQLVEIAKIMARNPRVLVLDEPTVNLSREETKRLFVLLKQWKSRMGIIFISHRLEEVLEVADRITVLRDGRKVGTLPRGEATEDKLISMMVGRSFDQRFPKERVPVGPVLLEVRNLETLKLKRVSLRVHRGEIVGLAGIAGAGRTSLLETIFGIHQSRPDAILLDGKPVGHLSPAERIQQGIYFVPENRRLKAVQPHASVQENLSLVHLAQACSFGFIRKRAERTMAQNLAQRFVIRFHSLSQPVVTLSGGNQQKVSLARWFAKRGAVLLMDEPTQGVDVGARHEIYKLITEMIRSGMGILFSSSELPELLGMADRIYVLREGRIVGEFERENFDQEAILKCAIGGVSHVRTSATE